MDKQYVLGGDIVNDNGSGGDSIYGEYFQDENFKLKFAHPGILAMYNKGHDKNNSQFLITLKTCPQFDSKFVVFGHVSKGMSVLREMASIPTDFHDRPKVKIFI